MLHATAPHAAAPLLDEEQIGLLADLDRAAEERFFDGLCEQFAGDARRTLVQMREFASHGDSAAIAREAHRLEGASASIGAAGLARDCKQIAQRLRAHGTRGLDALIEGAERHLEETMSALHGYIGRHRGGAHAGE